MMRWPWSKRRASVGGVAVRGFQAAQTDRLLAGWRSDIGYTPSEIAAHLETLRARSRQMAKDAPAFKRWLDLSAINIVGEGFRLKSTPHDGFPGSTNYRPDESAARFIEWHWWRFCNYRDPETGLTWCDAGGRKTDAEIDRLNVKTWKRDGEYFIHVIRTAANPYGIAWRVIRPDYCDHTYNVDALPNGNIVHCGVEMDPGTRRPVAYYFNTIPRNAYVWSARGLPLVRIPASEIIHGYTQDDEDQPRGIPQGHAGLVKLKMLEELDRAELTAAREEACVTRSYEADRDASMDGFKDLTVDENNAAAQALLMEKEPGQQIILPPGWKEKVNAPQHPNGNHTEFKDGLNKDVASAFGVEYSNAFNNWSGVSFSSVRVGTISERDGWIAKQNDMISQCKTPQFLMWLRSFLSLAVSGGLPLVKYDKFAEHGFRGRRWMWVDPMKDMNAAKTARDHGWKTDAQIAEDLGGDYDENCEQAARDRDARQKNGMPEPAGAVMSIATTNEGGDNENESQANSAK